MSEPEASIVVATRDRPKMVRETVESLVRQSFPAEAFEIIVADDSETAPIRAIMDEIAAAHPAHEIRYVRGEARGVNAARNAGIDEARGDLIIFADDDIEAPVDWLATLLQGVRSHPQAECVGGRVLLRIEGPLPRMCGRCDRPTTIEPEFDLEEDQPDTMWVWSTNMAVRRTAFERAGKFDPTLGTGGDEYEWEKRFKEAGGTIAYTHAAYIWHRRTPTDVSIRRIMRAKYNRGANNAYAQRVMGVKKKNPWKSIPKWLLHGLTRRCWNGVFVASYVTGEEAGRIRYRRRRNET